MTRALPFITRVNLSQPPAANGEGETVPPTYLAVLFHVAESVLLRITMSPITGTPSGNAELTLAVVKFESEVQLAFVLL